MIYAWVFAARFDEPGNAKTSTSGTGGVRVPRFFCYRLEIGTLSSGCKKHNHYGQTHRRNDKSRT